MDSNDFLPSALLLLEDPRIKERMIDLLPMIETIVRTWEPEELVALIAVAAAKLQDSGIELFKRLPGAD